MVREHWDKLRDHRGRRRVAATWINTTCSMISSHVHSNFLKHSKIHGLVQVQILAASWVAMHAIIHLKTRDRTALLSLLEAYNCCCVFPLCVPENPNLHQGPSHCGMQIHINIFVRTGNKKKERGERKGVEKKRKRFLQMQYNCTEQMNINVIVKLK